MDAEKVWFRHDVLCWELGTVVSYEGANIVVQTGGGSRHTVPRTDTHPCDPTHMYELSDIALMNNMHEGPLLALLQRRYVKNEIYTFTGDILISINPYKGIDGLYNVEAAIGIDYRKDRTPHVYTVAAKAYRTMMEQDDPSRKNQSLIVSGESGAGKTEACKHIMRFLANLSEQYTHSAAAAAAAAAGPGSGSSITVDGVSDKVKIEQKVLDCNPFLEAFGNAKTVRNDNSSRFGKFLKIEYSGGRIMGARMRHYLLEKARVIAPNDGERNYHIFYLLLAGATPAERSALSLKPPTEYSYLNHGGVLTVDGLDDAAEFAVVRTALETVGIDADTQSTMWRVLAAIIHLGNIQFNEHPTEGDPEAFIVNEDVSSTAAGLLGTPALPQKLCKRLVTVGRGSAYEKFLTAKQAAGARDALAKTIYEKLFSWLVDMVNRSLASFRNNTGFIGILDIFGFEIFVVNSFEQLCINYANEKLQNLFNHHIFVMELEQYKAEGVDIASIEFINNQPVVDLIDKKTANGILHLLDDTCKAGRGETDVQFLEKLNRTHRENPHYGKSTRHSHEQFSICHFAGEVAYYVDGFIEKNNDTLYTDLEVLMHASDFDFLPEIFSLVSTSEMRADAPSPRSGGRGGGGGGGGGGGSGMSNRAKRRVQEKTKSSNTIAFTFRKQLQALNETLLATTPHYVRCVKPNKLKSADLFDHPMILDQLLYSGVLETVRIRRQGFPYRESFLEFWRMCTRVGYQKLVPELADCPLPPPPNYNELTGEDMSMTMESAAEAKASAQAFLSAVLGSELWTLGRSKVFMKDTALEIINRRFRTLHGLRIQTWWRCQSARVGYKRGKRAVTVLQGAWKSIIIRRRFAKVAADITRLQAHIRRRFAVRKFQAMKTRRQTAAMSIQSTYRMSHTRKEFLTARRGVVRLQATARGHAARSVLQAQHASAVKIQSIARRRAATLRVARVRKARATGCLAIQAYWRMVILRNRFRTFRRDVVLAQAAWRGRIARLDAADRYAAVIQLQANWRALVAARDYRNAKRQLVRLQCWWRGWSAYQSFRRLRRACRRIETAIFAYTRSRVLTEWTQELHSACSWGDAAEVKALLDCSDMRYGHVRVVPPSARALVRNRYDGMKSVLHSAASSGSLPTVQLLIDRGVDPTVRDLFGATALHKAAVIGNSHLGTIKYLVRLVKARNPGFINAVTMNNETALDAAIVQQRSSSKQEHDEVIEYLVSAGGISHALGGTSEAAQKLVEDMKEGSATDAAKAAREQALLQRRQAERMNDPHYQFLFVAEQEKKRKAEEAARLEEERAAAAAAETARRDGELSRMSSEDGLASAIRDVMRASDLALDAERRARDEAARIARMKAAARAREEAAERTREKLRLEERRKAEAAISRVNKAHQKDAVFQELSQLELDRQQALAIRERLAAESDMKHRLEVVKAKAEQEEEVEKGVRQELAAAEAAGLSERRAVAVKSAVKPPTLPANGSSTAASSSSGTSSSKTSSADDDVVAGAIAKLTPAQLSWERHTTEDGEEYFHNPVTGVTQWDTPSEFTLVLEARRRANRLSASRRASAVSSKASTASLDVSDAAPVPVWTVHLSNSTGLLYYSNRLTGNTQWTEPDDFDGVYEDWMRPDTTMKEKTGKAVVDADVEMKKTTATTAAAVAVEKETDTDRKVAEGKTGLTSDWEEHRADDGKPYYFNPTTGVTQWDPPTGWPTPDNNGVGHLNGGSENGNNGGTAAAAAAASAVAVVTTGAASAPTAAAAPAAAEEEEDDGLEIVETGRNGWVAVVDDEGYKFYLHQASGETQWDQPTAF